MASKKPAFPWAFRAHFRSNVFGWKSQPAITRVREAVAEIKKIAKNDPIVAADGAALFLERVSPALAHVDSSSGAIGSAVNRPILTDCVPLSDWALSSASTKPIASLANRRVRRTEERNRLARPVLEAFKAAPSRSLYCLKPLSPKPLDMRAINGVR